METLNCVNYEVVLPQRISIWCDLERAWRNSGGDVEGSCIPSPCNNISLTFNTDLQHGFLKTQPALPHLWGSVHMMRLLECPFLPSQLCSPHYPLFLSNFIINVVSHRKSCLISLLEMIRVPLNLHSTLPPSLLHQWWESALLKELSAQTARSQKDLALALW